ncbi:MAG: hypothetical protein OFPI_10100 [Osedax symbiont Rs2]|nr:MAG: hypothetical protein OFPI_10100 [Osedax symbiont Rs2]
MFNSNKSRLYYFNSNIPGQQIQKNQWLIFKPSFFARASSTDIPSVNILSYF